MNWIKQNKLTAILLAVVAYLLFRNSPITYTLMNKGTSSGYNAMFDGEFGGGGPTFDLAMPSSRSIMPTQEFAPTPDIANRKVVTNADVSIVVKDVRSSLDLIQSEAEANGGYMVNTSINRPGEAANGWISVRIPLENRKSFIEFLRENSIKVVSENISGYDVTDQYVDIEERLRVLNRTKATFEGILNSATDVDDIIRVQDRILGVQSQIESLQGQMKLLDATSSTTLVAVNLSTDEFSLPYSPEGPWRPDVAFKLAVRSLVETLRDWGTSGIWIAVYSVLWLPALVAIIAARKWWLNRTKTH